MFTAIKVQFDFEGFHLYSGAPSEVEFLKNLHRHLFNIKVTIEVTHEDRELEFFIVRRQLIDLVNRLYPNRIVGSCEMMAKDIYYFVKHTYKKLDKTGDRLVEVEVSEDKENSGIVSDLIGVLK